MDGWVEHLIDRWSRRLNATGLYAGPGILCGVHLVDLLTPLLDDQHLSQVELW